MDHRGVAAEGLCPPKREFRHMLRDACQSGHYGGRAGKKEFKC